MTYEKFARGISSKRGEESRKGVAKFTRQLILFSAPIGFALGYLGYRVFNTLFIPIGVVFLYLFFINTMFEMLSDEGDSYSRWKKIVRFWAIPLVLGIASCVVTALTI